MLHSLISNFAVTNGCTPPSFFGLKPWYQYLETDAKCNVINFQVLDPANASDFLLIALVLVDDLLRIAGFVAIVFIIWGGVQYLTSQGSPEVTGKAQGTVQNALIGLIICLVAIALVSFLGSKVN